MKDLVIYLIIVGFAFIWAKYHKEMIDKTTDGNYDGGFPDMFIRFWVIMVCSFAYVIWKYSGSIPYPSGLWELPLQWIRFAGFFWMCFDVWLNHLRGKKFTYISTTNGKLFDDLFRGNFWLQLIIKISLQCVCFLI